jgi:glucan phosphoethanolaminetransferase (alkaline phosphatase superfamily)
VKFFYSDTVKWGRVINTFTVQVVVLQVDVVKERKNISVVRLPAIVVHLPVIVVILKKIVVHHPAVAQIFVILNTILAHLIVTVIVELVNLNIINPILLTAKRRRIRRKYIESKKRNIQLLKERKYHVNLKRKKQRNFGKY